MRSAEHRKDEMGGAVLVTNFQIVGLNKEDVGESDETSGKQIPSCLDIRIHSFNDPLVALCWAPLWVHQVYLHGETEASGINGLFTRSGTGFRELQRLMKYLGAGSSREAKQESQGQKPEGNYAAGRGPGTSTC